MPFAVMAFVVMSFVVMSFVTICSCVFEIMPFVAKPIDVMPYVMPFYIFKMIFTIFSLLKFHLFTVIC